MNRLKVLFSGIIAARVITGDRRGGFEHYLAKLVPSFRIGKTNRVRKHSQARESARRKRRGDSFNYKFVPRPHSAKFPPGTKQPLPQKRAWKWKPYYENPKHEPVGVIIDDIVEVDQKIYALLGHQSGKTFGRKVIYSGIKWRHINER